MNLISRRTACRWSIAALVTLGAPSVTLLAGCGSSDPATASARALGFSAALGDSYQAACDAMAEKADDARLMAVRSTSFSSADAKPSWMYLFYSWERACAYTVFVSGTTATAGDTGNLAITEEEFATLPSVDALAWDADTAYDQVLTELEGVGEFLTCRAYLMTYDETGEDELIWFFSFNDADDVASYLGDVEALGEVAPAQLWAVDAQSGEISCVTVNEPEEAVEAEAVVA